MSQFESAHGEREDLSQLPSLGLIAAQVASERDTMNAHAESLDAKAGVLLGFAGVLVGLSATAQSFISSNLEFRIGLIAAVLAALLAAFAYLPRKYPVIEVLQLREYLTTPTDETRLALLDVQINMVVDAAGLVKQKGRRVTGAVALLAVAAALVVVGTLVSTRSPAHHVRQPVKSQRRACSSAASAPCTASLQPE